MIDLSPKSMLKDAKSILKDAVGDYEVGHPRPWKLADEPWAGEWRIKDTTGKTVFSVSTDGVTYGSARLLATMMLDWLDEAKNV